MPVSKKRKKDGKPVRRQQEATEMAEQPHGPEAKSTPPQGRLGHPKNPFVAQQQSRRGAQRGR